jgi:hypothetical protein
MADDPQSTQPSMAAIRGLGERKHELFGFLTTKADAIVAPIHPKGIRLF